MNRKPQYSQDVSSSKLDPKIQCNANQIPATYVMNISKMTVKFLWRGKIPIIANKLLKEKNNVKTLTLPMSRHSIKL